MCLRPSNTHTDKQETNLPATKKWCSYLSTTQTEEKKKGREKRKAQYTSGILLRPLPDTK